MDSFLLQFLVAGLAMGAIYGLVALGFVLLINAVNIVNFAQGEFVMLGAFFVFTFGTTWGLPYLPAFLLVLLAAAVVGLVFERLAYRPLRRRGGDHATFLVGTLAVSVFLRNVAQQVWGPYPRAFTKPFDQRMLNWGEVVINPQYLLILAVTAALVGGLYYFFGRTRTGKMMRATAQDRQAAQLLGVRVARVGVLTFVLAAGLGALAGVLVAPVLFVNLDMGFSMGLKAFIASIIGGWGSVPGAITGGLILGLVEVLATAYLPSELTVYKDAFAFLILILFLIFLPRGLFGERVAEKA